MKLFVDIANSGDIQPLCISGLYDHEEAVEKWERIIQLNAEANGSFNFDTYFYLYQSYMLLVAKHIKVRALLWTLAHILDWEFIQEVRAAGYKIDTTNSSTYAKSIERCFRQSDNLVTKYETKKKELEKLSGGEDNSKEKETFEDIWAALSLAVAPMIVSEDIRLSQYNALKKRIEKKNQAARKTAK